MVYHIILSFLMHLYKLVTELFTLMFIDQKEIHLGRPD